MRNLLRYCVRIATRKPSRYRFLLRSLFGARARVIVEIGTHRGKNAVHMIQTANLFHPLERIEYFGFDLFEDLTPEELEKEFSLQPPPHEEVKRRLEATGAAIHLLQGHTKKTLPKFLEGAGKNKVIDFVFVDGGHSVETIASDWAFVRRMMSPRTVVIFDDYYMNSPTQVPGVGCQSLVDGLDRAEYDVRLQKSEDRFEHDWGTLRVKMASLRLRV